MKRSVHIKKKSKHNQLVQILYNHYKDKPYIDEIETNVEYGTPYRLYGEIDVYIKFNNGMEAYFEVKSRHSEKGYFKAKNQLKRWCKYGPNRLGLYWTPEVWKPMYKNERRI